MKSYSIYLITLLFTLTFCIDAPLIGIMTKPIAEDYPMIKTDYTEVIEAKYAHFIEGGGGRAVSISYKWDKNEMYSLMKKLNGVLFIGGILELVNKDRTELNEYSKAAQRILDIVYEFNEKGEYFPVWGVCLGFEMIMILEAKNTNLLQKCTNCLDYNIFITYNKEKANSSRLFSQGFTRFQLNLMNKENITYNNHEYMIDDATYKANKLLVEKYNVLAYSPSIGNEFTYIVAMEHKTFPIYAIQFHPEKYNYEVNPIQYLRRTFDSLTVSHAFANFFIEEARKSKHAFKDRKEEMDNLIQHSHPYYHPEFGYLYLSAKKNLWTN